MLEAGVPLALPVLPKFKRHTDLHWQSQWHTTPKPNFDNALEGLRKEVQIGLDQFDRGEFTEYDEESLRKFFEDIKAEGRRETMTPEFNDELRQAVQSRPGQVVRLQDDQTNKVYFLVEESQAGQFYEHWLRQELQKGFDAADRGDLVEWDAERIKAEGRRRIAEQSGDS